MKKKILIAVVVFLVAGIAVWKITSNKASNDVDNVSKNPSKTVEETSEANQGEDSQKDDSNKSEEKDADDGANSENTNSNDDTSTDIGNISGFTSEEGSGSKTDKNSSSKDTTKNNEGSKSMSLPYTIASTGMKIKSIGKYSGEFVEDGSDKKISNVLSIVVTNTSNKDLQYGEIKLKVNGDKTATFKLTNIPAGKSVLALESNSMKYSSSASYKYADATYANVDSMPMNSNKVKVSTSDSKVTIKNTSGKDLGTVYVYYKNLDKSGAYLGGITYRVKFDNVKKGDTLSQNTKHFSKSNSKIVMVDTEK